jgi:hypothetical protein
VSGHLDEKRETASLRISASQVVQAIISARDPKETLELPPEMQLIAAGTGIVWIGFVILMLGKRAERSFGEMTQLSGRDLFQNLRSYFNGTNILIFKVASYVGMTIVLAGVAWMVTLSVQ